MKLSSCRDLKLHVQGRAYRLAATSIRRRDYNIRKVRGKRKRKIHAIEDTPMAAIGVAPGKRKEYKLAVRIYRGAAQYQAELLRGLGKYMDEIDLVTGVRYKPRLTMKAGGSIGHYKITAGTLGGFVEDEKNYYMIPTVTAFSVGAENGVRDGTSDNLQSVSRRSHLRCADQGLSYRISDATPRSVLSVLLDHLRSPRLGRRWGFTFTFVRHFRLLGLMLWLERDRALEGDGL